MQHAGPTLQKNPSPTAPTRRPIEKLSPRVCAMVRRPRRKRQQKSFARRVKRHANPKECYRRAFRRLSLLNKCPQSLEISARPSRPRGLLRPQLEERAEHRQPVGRQRPGPGGEGGTSGGGVGE